MSTRRPGSTARPRRRPRGLTLIEAIIAVVVIGAAVPPILLAVRDASVKRAAPIRAAQARWLAAEKLEDVIADRHSTARGYGYVVAGNYPAESSISGFAGFSRSTSIVETGASLSGGGTGFKTVTVAVTWRDSAGPSRSFSLSTVVTDY